MNFSISEITLRKVLENSVYFSTSEIRPKKSAWKQRGFFDHHIYAEKCMWKQRGFFYQQLLHRKSTLKLRRNSSKYGLRRINVISTWNRRRFNVVCLLGSPSLIYIFSLLSLVGTSVKCLFPLIS